jgi:uncharacterized membrane protein YebE (DUF533 family)
MVKARETRSKESSMLDAKRLLDQVLGGDVGRALGNVDKGSFAGGALTGGLLGLLLGGKKMRKMAGGLAGYGGAAAIGALAHRAYQSYRDGEPAGTAASPTDLRNVGVDQLPHAKPAADGGSFELVLVHAMIAAAKADGHVDADEQRRLFSEVERMKLDSEEKAFVFDALSRAPDLNALTSRVNGQDQASELYLASRLAIDPDHPAERVYLDALAARLELPDALRASLDAQAAAVLREAR